MNDGVQYARSHRRWFFWDGSHGCAQPEKGLRYLDDDEEEVVVPWWMPPLYPHTWRIYMDHVTQDVCIALDIPMKTNVNETWNEIASGRWSQMWPLFLSYVALAWGNPNVQS